MFLVFSTYSPFSGFLSFFFYFTIHANNSKKRKNFLQSLLPTQPASLASSLSFLGFTPKTLLSVQILFGSLSFLIRAAFTLVDLTFTAKFGGGVFRTGAVRHVAAGAAT
jgi:hypothetical protein